MEEYRLVAPCGMNCKLCQAYQGKGLKCYGCGNGGERKSCQNCSILKCENKNNFCFECKNYPCNRLKKLNKRYKIRYRMSMLENLEFIKTNGINKFIKQQDEKYKCDKCGKLRTVHQEYCIHCSNVKNEK